MRVLKDGTIRYKPSAVAHAERMSRPPQPLPVLRRQSKTRIYTGCGWTKATVMESSSSALTVKTDAGKTVTVFDQRNVETDAGFNWKG